MSVLIEVCVDSVHGALAAERAGAERLELCANLVEGGTTPSVGMMRAAVHGTRLPVFAMVRPRGGDFLYDAAEIEVMLRDVEGAKGCDVDGIVSGALNPDGTIDEDGTAALLEAAHPLPFTFHRAFDLTRDLDESLDTLLALGVPRVLTSGGAPTAAAGTAVLARLVRRAGSRMTVMAGGGVRAENALHLVRESRVREIHMRGARRVESRMTHRPVRALIARGYEPDDFAWSGTDEAAIRHVVGIFAAPPVA